MVELEGAIERIRHEIPAWRDFLNNVLASLGFGFGLGAVQTENPSLYAFLAMIVIGGMAFSSGRFPRTLTLLRQKRGVLQADRDYVRAITPDALSGWSLLRHFWLFMISWIFLAAIFSGLLTSKGFTILSLLGK